jgi:hypothetical protein
MNDYQKKAQTTNVRTIRFGAALFNARLTAKQGNRRKNQKVIRNNNADYSTLDREDITKELGDVFVVYSYDCTNHSTFH